VQSACALKRGQRSVMLMPAAVFSPDVCIQESCHTGRCVYDGGRLLNQPTRVAVTALMVFTHVYRYTASTLCRIPVGLHAVYWWRLGVGRHVERTSLTSDTENYPACTI